MNRFVILIALFVATFTLSDAQQLAPLGKILTKNIDGLKETDEVLVLISFYDKGSQQLAATPSHMLLSDRAIARRAKVRPPSGIIDEQDLPLNQSYVKAVEKNVLRIRHQLKWFNAVSAMATKQQIQSLRLQPFIREIEVIGRWKTNKVFEQASNESSTPPEANLAGTDTLSYGTGLTQVSQINVPSVHNLGIYGQGVVVGVFDNGFRLPNHESFATMNIIATYDFVDHKKSVVPNNPSTSYGSHGVNTLSTIGGYKSGQLIGPAFKADFILARTENDSSETPIEEDNWAKAIEWADSIGVDVTSTSLGYLSYDYPYTSWTWEDMDGNTTLITRAADRAAGLGIVVVNSAGNDGSSTHNTLGAPADGDSVITAGAVDASGSRSSFSSVGPTTDTPARIKPDIMAMGSGVKVASSSNTTGYGNASGTSFSCPLSAGAAALVVCSNPTLTPMQVREALRQTASNSLSPNNTMGWGIINTRNAIGYYGISPSVRGTIYNDLNGNGVKDTNETGLAGMLVRITGTKYDSTYTDADGNYLFYNLSVGNFSISMTNVPSGSKILFPSNGSFGITIDSTKMVQTGKNFSIVEYAIVHGSVYEDINGNGAKDTGEPGIPGWTVKIDTQLSALTDGNGDFTFEQVDGGTVTLSESLRTGWIQTSLPVNYTFNLSYGQEVSGYQFGVFRTGSIQGTIFNDNNSNSIKDLDEAGLPNWKILLTGSGTGSTITDSDGNYIFTNLGAGTYAISESLMFGWGQTVPPSNGNFSITLRSGLDTTDLDFGNYFAPYKIYAVTEGWNLVSVPQALSNRTLSAVYPSAQSSAITYQKKYYSNDTVPESIGFWLKFSNPQNIYLTGELITADTIAVAKGWNIVGSISDPIAISSIITQPDSLISTGFFRYSSAGYTAADSIMPHAGYWVKVKNDGVLILQSPIQMKQKVDAPTVGRKIKY